MSPSQFGDVLANHLVRNADTRIRAIGATQICSMGSKTLQRVSTAKAVRQGPLTGRSEPTHWEKRDDS